MRKQCSTGFKWFWLEQMRCIVGYNIHNCLFFLANNKMPDDCFLKCSHLCLYEVQYNKNLKQACAIAHWLVSLSSLLRRTFSLRKTVISSLVYLPLLRWKSALSFNHNFLFQFPPSKTHTNTVSLPEIPHMCSPGRRDIYSNVQCKSEKTFWRNALHCGNA